MDISTHNTQKVEVGKIKRFEATHTLSGYFYARDITAYDDRGNRLHLTLFGEEAENLKFS